MKKSESSKRIEQLILSPKPSRPRQLTPIGPKPKEETKDNREIKLMQTQLKDLKQKVEDNLLSFEDWKQVQEKKYEVMNNAYEDLEFRHNDLISMFEFLKEEMDRQQSDLARIGEILVSSLEKLASGAHEKTSEEQKIDIQAQHLRSLESKPDESILK